MRIGRSRSSSPVTETETKKEISPDCAEDIRVLIAKYLGVSVERITDHARFADDFGADWLDRLEIIMMIEDQVPGLEITDDHIDRLESVGELIRLVQGREGTNSEERTTHCD